jgi:hypothetical protein
MKFRVLAGIRHKIILKQRLEDFISISWAWLGA